MPYGSNCLRGGLCSRRNCYWSCPESDRSSVLLDGNDPISGKNFDSNRHQRYMIRTVLASYSRHRCSATVRTLLRVASAGIDTQISKVKSHANKGIFTPILACAKNLRRTMRRSSNAGRIVAHCVHEKDLRNFLDGNSFSVSFRLRQPPSFGIHLVEAMRTIDEASLLIAPSLREVLTTGLPIARIVLQFHGVETPISPFFLTPQITIVQPQRRCPLPFQLLHISPNMSSRVSPLLFWRVKRKRSRWSAGY